MALDEHRATSTAEQKRGSRRNFGQYIVIQAIFDDNQNVGRIRESEKMADSS